MSKNFNYRIIVAKLLNTINYWGKKPFPSTWAELRGSKVYIWRAVSVWTSCLCNTDNQRTQEEGSDLERARVRKWIFNHAGFSITFSLSRCSDRSVATFFFWPFQPFRKIIPGHTGFLGGTHDSRYSPARSPHNVCTYNGNHRHQRSVDPSLESARWTCGGNSKSKPNNYTVSLPKSAGFWWSLSYFSCFSTRIRGSVPTGSGIRPVQQQIFLCLWFGKSFDVIHDNYAQIRMADEQPTEISPYEATP